MTQEEILDTIAPVLKMHRARGLRLDVTTDPDHIMIKPGGGAFSGSFIQDLGGVCRENMIGWAIGALDNQPYCLL